MANVLSFQPNKTELVHIWFELFFLVGHECVFNAVNWEHYTVISIVLLKSSDINPPRTVHFFFFYLLDQSVLPSVVTALLVCLVLSFWSFFYCKFYNTVWMKTPCEGCVYFLMSN